MAPREIAIATKYDRKFTEFERHFTAYGIKCVQLKTWDVREFKKWLKTTPKQHIAVLQEHTDLLAAGDRSVIIDAGESPELHLTKVIHKSDMKAWTLTPETHHLTYKDYECETHGYLSYTDDKTTRNPVDCYDWDDIFVIPDTGLSIYETAKRLGHKVSSRDKNIAAFIQDRIYYKELCNLAFDPIDMKQPVDFSVDPLDTLAKILPDFAAIFKNPPSADPHVTMRPLKGSTCYLEDTMRKPDFYIEYYDKIDGRWQGLYENSYYPDPPSQPATSDDPIKCFLHNIIIKCLNLGTFLRAPENRREKLYWVPGLNSGLPLTKKAEQGHERIYRFHDCGHHGIPDLVFISPEQSNERWIKPVSPKMHKATYVLHRLMTEAFSLVTGDMLGTNYLQTEHGQYETAYKRKIIQVYQTLPEWFRQVENLKDLYYLVYQLVFYGKSVEELSMARGFSDGAKAAILETSAECNDALAGFLEKYRTYGLDDFYWTMANYEDMLPRAKEFDALYETSRVVKLDDGYSSVICIDDTINGYFDSMNDNCPHYLPGVSKINTIYDLTECIFHDMYAGHVNPYIKGGQVVDLFTPAIRTAIGFCRYMYGQSLIFKRFAFLPESDQVFKLINSTLATYFLNMWTDCGGALGDDAKYNTMAEMERMARQFVKMIPRIRAIYNDYLDLLFKRNLITQDDRDTFKEVYPIFRPVYVDYDQDTFANRLAIFEEFVKS